MLIFTYSKLKNIIMIKKSAFTIYFVLLFFVSQAQPWTELLPEKEKNKITFFDHQKAFNEYWKKYDVKKGKYIDENGKEQKAYGWKQFKRWEYFWESRVNQVTGEFRKIEMYEAYKKYKNQLNSNKSKNVWVSSGPNSSNGGYAGTGRLSTIAFHPISQDIFWVGAPAGGVWKTEAGGNDWVPLCENNEVLGVSAIVVPSDYDVSQTLYIGTGDRDAFDNHSIGVLKSIDGGVTWQTTGLQLLPQDGDAVNNMLIDPANNDLIYAATTDGFYKTTDAAVTWIETSTIPFVDIEFNTANSNIIYGSTRNGRIYKSIDAGENWTESINTSSGRVELAVTENDPYRVYAVVSNSANGLEGIYRSDDSGDSFNMIFNSLYILNWSTNGTGINDGQGWYDLSLAADHNNADVLFCGGVNTWKSVDGGYSWQLASHWYGGGGVQAVHADKHYLKFIPGTSTLFECNDGGVYKTDNGSNWTDLTNGLVISQMYGISTAQTQFDVTIAGLQDNGTKSRLTGFWYDVLGGDGMKCLIDFTDANVQYGSLYYGDIYRTVNSWSSSTNISNNIPGGAAGAWVTPYVLDPNDNNTLYVGYNTLWKSEDRGNSFVDIGNFGTLKVITVAPSNSNIICAATSSTISKTNNGGVSWINITNGLPTTGSAITDISIKFNNPDVIWVTLSGYDANGVFETTDGGDTWTNISNGLPEIPVNTIIQNKYETLETQLYVGTDFGVYIKNGNSDWILYGTELPKVVVSELDIYYDNSNPYNSKLRAGTYGRGLWETDLELTGNFAPYVSSLNVSNIGETSATVGGEINNDYGSTITESGVIYATFPNPDYGEAGVMNVTTNPLVSSGAFNIDLTGLNSGTTYYYKAYAKNINGIGQGQEFSFITNCSIFNAIPYTEGFENFGNIPNCWSENYVLGEADWSYGELPDNGIYEGSYSAYFKDNTISDNKTLLEFPVFDFSSYTELKLTFWHVQSPLFSFQDELKVLYKSNVTDAWTELAYYNSAIEDWTWAGINLPNLSSTYYLAFEANAKNGRGVGIDNVLIDFGSSVNDLKTDECVISPNPSEGLFFIYKNNNNPAKVIVYDINGKEVFQNNYTSSEFKIDLSNLKGGTYFIKIIEKSEVYNYKIILN